RVEIGILRPELLIAKAAHRTAAASIEAPRRGEALARGAEDRADPHASRYDDAVGDRIIAADVEAGARIRGELAAQGAFRLHERGDAEALGRVEQAVGAVHADLPGQPENVIKVAITHAAREIIVILARRNHLSAIGIGEFLLPDRRRLNADPRGEAPGQRFEG